MQFLNEISNLWPSASREDADFADIFDEDEKVENTGLPFGLSLKAVAALGVSIVAVSGIIYYGLGSKKVKIKLPTPSF